MNMLKTAVVTGGAGFIGSQLVDKLIQKGYRVIATDMIPDDKAKNIAHLKDEKNFEYVCMDINKGELPEICKGCDCMFHLAANSDIRVGGQNPTVDFENTLTTTKSVLDAMKQDSSPRMFFSSTSAVYGDKSGRALTEDEGDLRPISYYGASKLASEALISAYSYMNSFDALVFRFPNVVGPRLTHGVIFDFIEKLRKDPRKLQILGDGKQNKQYVYSPDLVDGIVDFMDRDYKGMNIFNISTESFTDVNTIADIICREMGLKDVEYEYTGGNCGWKGDVPSFDYDISKAKAAGWKFRYNSTQAVEMTVRDALN